MFTTVCDAGYVTQDACNVDHDASTTVARNIYRCTYSMTGYVNKDVSLERCGVEHLTRNSRITNKELYCSVQASLRSVILKL